MNPLRVGFTRVAETFAEIRQFKHLFLFLAAFWFYNDGINTIIKMANAYGAELGIGTAHLLGAFLMVQFLGIPATFAYGALAARIGAKKRHLPRTRHLRAASRSAAFSCARRGTSGALAGGARARTRRKPSAEPVAVRHDGARRRNRPSFSGSTA